MSTDAVVVTDARGYIQYVNPAFERMTGYSANEAAGRSLHFLDSGRHEEDFYKGIRSTLESDGIWKGRLTSRKKDGTLYYEECTHSRVKAPSGKIIGHLSIRRDETERLRLESMVEEIDAMKNSGQVVSGICHEIGNAVNTLVMILAVLKTKLDRLDTAAIARYVESAADEADKAAYIVRCLKNYNIHAEPELQPVKLPEFVKNILALVQDAFTAKGIEIKASIDADVERCFADPRALHQVMLNVLINASDALEGRAHPGVFIRISRSGENVRVRVEDNGCGMSDEQLRNLFKPFYTTKPNGTGLGLVIIKRLLTVMNSSIEITSSKNAGTRIDIFIPGLRASIDGASEDLSAAAA
jgi:PAS domain S-box-containing protein